MKRNEKKDKNGFLKGAAWIAVGGFVAKLVGAAYRIPLTNLIGGRGLGLYQMVYPVYCLLLTVSATGIPSSIAKLTAERLGKGESAQPLFKRAMGLFLWIGGVGTAFMCVSAFFLSKAQGSEEVLGGYFALAPSVLLVSAISVFRGYFQGKNNMRPTALSEITEQVIKVGFGLLFAYLFRDNIVKAVTFLLLAVSLSELCTLLFMVWCYRRDCRGRLPLRKGESVSAGKVLRLSIPVTFSAMVLPLSGLLDSVLAPRLLSAYSADAVTLYGLFAGGAVTMINLPVSVCYGIAAASVPAVAAAVAVGKGTRKRIWFSLFTTVAVGIPSAASLYLFAEPAAKLIFRALRAEELSVLVGLIKGLSVSALTLSCIQTLSACLTAQGKPQYAALSMLAGVGVKTALYCWWMQDAKISVFALTYATNICYLLVFFMDLLYNLAVSKKRRKE